MNCPSCEVVMINGMRCHEHGCPDAWKDYDIECQECGTMFRPHFKDQRNCSHSCDVAYSGHECGCAECSPYEG